MSHLLEEVQMKALACVMHLKEKNSQMQFREALIPIASELELDDVGYFYSPTNPDAFYTRPGQLVGALSKWLPRFSLGIAVKTTIDNLDSLDEDYKRTLIIATDYFEENDFYYLEQALEQDMEKSNIFLFIFKEEWDGRFPSHSKLTVFNTTDFNQITETLKAIQL